MSRQIYRHITSAPAADARSRIPAAGPTRVAGRIVGCVVAATAFGLALAPSSRAGVGDIAFAECIANDRTGCVDLPNDPLSGATDVAVSPDGSSVYVASYGDASLSHFSRDAAGQLSFEGCVANEGLSGCIDPAIDSLAGAKSVAVSPDGSSVYVASYEDDSLTHFSRSAAGGLSYQGCIAQSGQTSGCSDAGRSLDGANSVAVSPDGTSVYAASYFDDSLTHFSRDDEGGISFQGCIADDGQSGCHDAGPDPLAGAFGVEVSPDGSSVYVASYEDDSLTHFSRDAAGQIFFRGCIADGGGSGCFDVGADPLAGATSVAVSPDGSSVYVASERDDSLTHFSRNAAGQIFFVGCLADDGQSGCFDPPIDALNGAREVAVSPDGSSVYVASYFDDSLTHFSRDDDGRALFAGCIADGGQSGCVDPALGVVPLARASSVAVAPDGTSAYVAAPAAGALTRFSREGPDTTKPVAKVPVQRFTPNTTLGTNTAGASIPQRISWAAGTDNVTPSNQLTYRLFESVNGGAYAPVTGFISALSVNRTLTPGSTYRYRVQARDQAGNVSNPATGPLFRPLVRQENAATVAYTGTWLARQAQSTAYGGFVRPTATANALATSNFSSARNVAVVMRKASTLGTANICLFQGATQVVCSNVDLSPASGLGPRKVVFARDGLNPTRGYSVRVKDVSGRIELDAIVIND